MHQCAMRRA
ncbi:hypothetical protein LINGRAHAP2_LOCUS22349 [Linum grandiflorum]